MNTRGTAEDAPGEELTLHLDAAWGIPAIFGGALAATVLRADHEAHDSGWLPTEVQVTFHRSAQPGPARAWLEVLQAGRTKRSTLTRVTIDGRLVVTVQAGWTREGDLEVVASPPPDTLPGPADRAPGDLSERVDWRAERAWPVVPGGGLDAWIRPRDRSWQLDRLGGAMHPAWYLIAGDLLAPAVARRGESLRILTVSLQLTVVRLAETGWIRQAVRAERTGDRATASLELRSSAGEHLASVQQSALLFPATPEEMPVSATGFGWGGKVPADYINTSYPHAID